jgi:outer membrane cobalamin receptor
MRRAFLAAATFPIVALTALAAGAGTLDATLRSPEGAALPGVVVRVEGPGLQASALTGPDGRFRVAAPAGEYRLSVDLPGFVLSQPSVALGEHETRLTLTLDPAPVREHVLVTATRGEAALATLGVSGTVLDAQRLAEREPTQFVELLREVPGLSVARTGGVGLQSSAFVRGGESRFARVLVDGVPLNQPGGAYDFGSLQPLELEQVEVVRGAASSLYGSDALAGVVQLVTRRAAPDAAPGAHADAEGGSFDWWRGLAGSSGRAGSADWNFGIQRLTTDNDAPNSRFEQTAAAASLGAGLGSAGDLRFVLRADDSSVGTPGQTVYGRPDLDAHLERTDWALGARYRRPGPGLSHELRLGYADSDQFSVNPLDSGPYLPTDPETGRTSQSGEFFDFFDPDGFQNDVSRLSAGYQLEARAGARHLLTAGADLEHESGEIRSAFVTRIDPSRTNYGAYLQDRMVVGGRAYLTLGGRVEHNDSYGTHAVPRAALAVRLRGGEDAITLRASAGAGIKEPSFLESFGVDESALGNPDLKPERSRTYDVGFEQRAFDGRLRGSATFFHHDYLDQVAFTTLSFNPFRGTYVNLGRTRAEGLELAVSAAPNARLLLDAQYTLTDSEVVVSSNEFDPLYAEGAPLLRRPKHQGSLTARYAGGRFGLGATLLLVGTRADSDFSGIGLTENPGYARLDARARGRIARGLEGYLAAENLLDQEHQESLGYPAPGLSLRLGLRYRSGAER